MASSLLPDRAIVAVEGDDAEALLNRLFTRNLLGMAAGSARYAALLSPQGKLLVDFLVLKHGATFWLDCPRDQAAEFAKRLTMFRLRAKATIAVLDTVGAAAMWDAVPRVDAIDAFRDPRHPALGFRLVGDLDALASVLEQDDYRAHRIALGIAEGGADWPYGDSFVHDANLDLLGGVDFDKGCFVGQEVVSRVHHRGTARKRIVKVRFFGEVPTPETELRAGPVAIGQVTSIAGREGLAAVRIDRLREAAESGLPVTAGETLVEITVPDTSVSDAGASETERDAATR